MDTNVCDKCKIELNTNNLVWITGEGFTPRKNEIVPIALYKRYDALCEKCYSKLIGK